MPPRSGSKYHSSDRSNWLAFIGVRYGLLVEVPVRVSLSTGRVVVPAGGV